MNVYIKSLNNFPLFDMGVTALQGFRENGTNVFLYEDLDEVPLNRYTLLVTSIEETKEWFRRMEWLESPELDTIPKELNLFGFLKRYTKESTLLEDCLFDCKSVFEKVGDDNFLKHIYRVVLEDISNLENKIALAEVA